MLNRGRRGKHGDWGMKRVLLYNKVKAQVGRGSRNHGILFGFSCSVDVSETDRSTVPEVAAGRKSVTFVGLRPDARHRAV